jgi:hypothetical protein
MLLPGLDASWLCVQPTKLDKNKLASDGDRMAASEANRYRGRKREASVLILNDRSKNE